MIGVESISGQPSESQLTKIRRQRAAEQREEALEEYYSRVPNPPSLDTIRATYKFDVDELVVAQGVPRQHCSAFSQAHPDLVSLLSVQLFIMIWITCSQRFKSPAIAKQFLAERLQDFVDFAAAAFAILESTARPPHHFTRSDACSTRRRT